MLQYIALVIALAIGLGGCATAATSGTPVAITDVKQLAGHWTGWVFRPQVSGSTVTTIRPDGTFTASTNYSGTTDVYGTISVKESAGWPASRRSCLARATSRFRTGTFVS